MNTLTLTSFADSRLAHVVESRQPRRKFGRAVAPVVLEVPFLFDDVREAAETLCERLLGQLGPRYAIHLLPWKTTVTQFPTLTDIVAREALRAPFMLVTLNGANTITPEVEALIRRCAAALQRGGGALVAQLYDIARDAKEWSSAYRTLKQIADDSHIPIFSTVVELNQQSRGAGRASPRRNGSPFVAFPPQTLLLAS